MTGKNSNLTKSGININLNKDKNRSKLTFLDLDNEQNKKMTEIENILRGGITDTKLNQLKIKYKDNKKVIELINIYKEKKNTIEEHNNDTNISSISNSNSSQTMKLKKNNTTNNVNSKVINYSNYDISRYNKNNLNEQMRGKRELTREEIIQNKLDIFKQKICCPFFEKIKKEKANEFKRIRLLKQINDPMVKESVEEKFAIERGKVDMELTKEKEKINKQIKNYKYYLLQSENLSSVNANPNIFF
jgi:hypothetical protein